MSPRSTTLFCALLLAAGIAARSAAADEPAAKPAAARPELPAYSAEREAAALAFVAEHHPELSEVLRPLKTLAREQYVQAIRELSLTIDRLAMMKAKDGELYDLLLDAWKVNSRIEVLAARLAAAKEKDTQLEAELKQQLYRQVDLQRQQVEHNRKRVLASLEGMEKNIQWLAENREQLVERRFGSLTQGRPKGTAKKSRQAAAAPKRPGAAEDSQPKK